MSDNEALNADVRQLQQERLRLLQRVHTLELQGEELRCERDEIVEGKNREREDFMAQIEANEKHLTSYRKFLEEQTHEREVEREESTKEVVALKEKLKEKEKSENKLKTWVEELEAQINILNDEKNGWDQKLYSLSVQLKNAIQEINNLKQMIETMEKENEKSSLVERELRNKIEDLSRALSGQIKENEDMRNDAMNHRVLEQITNKTVELQNTLKNYGDSDSEDTSFECSYNDVQQLSEKLASLNDCIDKLMIQNGNLRTELEQAKSSNQKEFNELLQEKEGLERSLMQITRTTEILQEELNEKHLQLSALKSRLESDLDAASMKAELESLQQKMLAQETLSVELRQLQQERMKLIKRIHGLETQNDEQKTTKQRIIDQQNREIAELTTKLEVKEKELYNRQRYIDEESRERKTEREEFIKNTNSLTQKLDEKEIIECRLKLSIEDLECQIRTLKNDKDVCDKKLSSINEQLKNASFQITSLTQGIKKLEREVDRSSKIEYELQNKIKDLSQALNCQIKENEDLKNYDFKNNAILEHITRKTIQLQNALRDYVDTETEARTFEYHNSDAHKLNDKLATLSLCIDKLLIQHNKLRRELGESKSQTNKEVSALKKEKINLQKNLIEITRTTESLEEDLKDKHTQISALRSKLENNFDVESMRTALEDLQQKLKEESKRTALCPSEVFYKLY